MKIVSFDLLSVIFCLLVLRQSAGTSADGISDASYKTAQAGDLSLIITESLFNEMLKHRGDAKCRGAFYRYSSFLTAARSFSGFGTTGDNVTRKREIAAFFAQTSYQTSGGWSDAPDGPYAWGYCLLQEQGNPSGTIFCSGTKQWPCATGKKYYGRGPFMISWNHNYGPAGKAIGVDLLNNPDLVTSDPVISFKTALWYWMTPQVPKPSSHDVITEQWTPSPADRAAKRLPGYGVITNIINGALECGRGNSESSQSQSRIGFYRRYCTILGVTPGENLGCANQKSF